MHVVVAGGGVMGAATAWVLAARGHAVTLLEQHAPGHTLGSSHGSGRIFRIAYDDPLYAGLATQALSGWRRLEAETGTRVLRLTGAVDHGPESATQSRARVLSDLNVGHELLTPAAAHRRWPSMRFDRSVLFHPTAGRIHADLAVAAFTSAALRHGATIYHGHHVVVVTRTLHGVRVVTATGATFEADVVVLAAGAWSATLAAVAGVELPPLRVTLEQPVTFTTARRGPWPCFIHHPGAGIQHPHGVYGLRVNEGLKVGAHARGREVDPRQDDRRPDPAAVHDVVEYAREWLPGVDAGTAEPAGCLYTLTADHDFVVDRVDDVVVLAGFSGHGFKFAPAVADLAAGLALGTAAAPHRFTSLSLARSA